MNGQHKQTLQQTIDRSFMKDDPSKVGMISPSQLNLYVSTEIKETKFKFFGEEEKENGIKSSIFLWKPLFSERCDSVILKKGKT